MAKKMGCFCTTDAIWDGYEPVYGEDEGACGLPKCWDHPYCFCSGGTRNEDCGHCTRIYWKRKEGHLLFIDWGDFGKVQRLLQPDYEGWRHGINKIVWPNSKFVKEYRKWKELNEA